jgi:hypothetical protein
MTKTTNLNRQIHPILSSISVLFFLTIGIWRLSEEDLYFYYEELVVLYTLLVVALCCSSIHQIFDSKYTFIIGCLPIIASVSYLLYNHHLLEYVAFVSWLKIILLSGVLVADYNCKIIDHTYKFTLWRVLILLAVEVLYQDIYFFY